MNQALRKNAEKIARGAIDSVSPEAAVRRALEGKTFSGKLYLVSVGKAAWKMAEVAASCLEQPLEAGIVVTKYDHVEHPIPGVTCYEAGHPVPDENSYRAAQAAIDAVRELIVSGAWDVFSGVKLHITVADGAATVEKADEALVDNTGAEIVAAGGPSVEDSVITGTMNYFVAGVEVA